MRRSFHICAALDPDNANILVAGGGGIAMHVARKLKDMGSWVWVLQRSTARKSEIEGMMAALVKADALERNEIDKAFEGEIGGQCEGEKCSPTRKCSEKTGRIRRGVRGVPPQKKFSIAFRSVSMKLKRGGAKRCWIDV